MQGVTGREIKRFHNLLEAYVVSGKEDFYNALLKRIKVFLTWPTGDLLGSQVMTALSLSYDALYDKLPDKTRTAMLKCVEKQMKWGLKQWPGKTEARQIDNHFWQMELSGNFCAALATVGESEVAKDMLEYTYELFIARFPNLSTKSGKSKKMRFLAIIQLGDKGNTLLSDTMNKDGNIKLGDILIKAEMDASKSALMTVETPESTLTVYGTDGKCGYTSLKEKGEPTEVVCRNQYPEQIPY